jgi:hypothetical protein
MISKLNLGLRIDVQGTAALAFTVSTPGVAATTFCSDLATWAVGFCNLAAELGGKP